MIIYIENFFRDFFIFSRSKYMISVWFSTARSIGAREISAIGSGDRRPAYTRGPDCQKYAGASTISRTVHSPLRRSCLFPARCLLALWKKKRFGHGAHGAKTVMCRLNVNGDSRLFQPLGPSVARLSRACVRVTNYGCMNDVTREESAREHRTAEE